MAKIVLSKRQRLLSESPRITLNVNSPRFLEKRSLLAFGHHGSPNVRVVHSSPLGKLLRDNALYTHFTLFSMHISTVSRGTCPDVRTAHPSPLGELLCKDALHARFTNCLTVFRSLGWLALRPREGHYDSGPCSKKGTYRS